VTKTIVITWMDGPVATYENAAASVLEGVLHITIYSAPPRGAPVDEWHFPASNIRAWGPRAWEANHSRESVG